MKIHGHILTPDGFKWGELTVRNGRIERIEGIATPTESVRQSAECIVLPGFIDTHVHGGGGRDIMEGGDAARRVSSLHLQHGTTSLLATTMTAPTADLSEALGALGSVIRDRPTGSARILGVHLEGPYINPGKLGAQPNYARAAELGELQRLHALAPIRLITLAPEIPGNMEIIGQLVAEGCRVQIGHTLGTYEDGVDALRHGATGFTHLFNAMTGLHHREPGMVGAALGHARYSEIIPDLVHAHPGAIRVALRAIPCLFCVTDSTAAAGMPDGEYRLGRHKVTKCMGGVRLADGTLAGSTLTMDQALRNLVGLGLALDDASRRVSTFAADFLGLADRGRLVEGAWADLVVLDRALELQSVYTEGEKI